MSAIGTIYWTELLTDDIAGSTTFFTEVVGWRAEEMPGMDGKYVLMKNEAGPVCGIMSIAGTHMEAAGSGPVWMGYIGVGDVGRAVDKTIQAGGAVIQPPFDVPGVGQVCLLSDQAGVPFGIIRPTP